MIVRIFIVCCLFTVGAVTAHGSETTRVLEDISVLDLQTAQQIALADNPTMAAAGERVQQAKARLEQAGALYWPNLDLNGAAARIRLSDNEVAGAAPGVGIDQDYERYQLSLAASWLAFDGFARKFAIMAAEYGHQESVLGRMNAQRLLLQAVADGFYAAQLARHNKAISLADMEFNRQQLQEAQSRMDAGAGSLSAVLNFKVQMNKAQTDILLAGRDYEIARSALAVLLGRHDSILPEKTELSQLVMLEEAVFLDPDLEKMTAEAMEQRPDLLQQEYGLQRAESRVGSARAPYYPTLALKGSVDGRRIDDIALQDSDFGTTVSLNLSYNLFRGGADKARVAEASSARREAVKNLRQRKNELSFEVRQAIVNLRQAQQQLVLQKTSTDLVEQTRDLVQDGYAAGQESLVRLNEAQRDLVRTQSLLALSLVGLYKTRAVLQTVTGESIQGLTSFQLE